MKVTRKTPDVINDPLLILGVERVAFCLLLALFFVLLFKESMLIAGVATSVCYLGLASLTRKDPQIAMILFNVWFLLKDTYDPCKRVMFELEIIEETEEI